MFTDEQHSAFQRDLDSLLQDFSDSSDNQLSPPPDGIPHGPQVENVYACGDCGRGLFSSLKKLRAHQQQHKPRLISCPCCQKTFKWPSGLRRHLETVHKKVTDGPRLPSPPSMLPSPGPERRPSPPALPSDADESPEAEPHRDYYCSECGMMLSCITLLAKHVRKVHGFAISIRSPYLDTLKSPCCRANACTGTNEKRGAGLAPSVMMADSTKAVKLETKAFSCLICHIAVRREDLLDHQMVHMRDMGRGGKSIFEPVRVEHHSNAAVKKELKGGISGQSFGHTRPSTTRLQEMVQDSTSSSSSPPCSTSPLSVPASSPPCHVSSQSGAIVDVNSVLAAIWASNPDQVPVLVAGASVISYCKSCWKVCQMEIPPGKVELDLSEFRCFTCAGTDQMAATAGAVVPSNTAIPNGTVAVANSSMSAPPVAVSVGTNVMEDPVEVLEWHRPPGANGVNNQTIQVSQLNDQHRSVIATHPVVAQQIGPKTSQDHRLLIF